MANKYLGYPYELSGTVVQGKQIGRDIGFPTANLSIDESYKLIPAYGIYAVEVSVVKPATFEEGEFQDQTNFEVLRGMGYIGTRPTIDGIKRSIEVNILDYNEDLYGKTLKIKFLNFIRHDFRFDSLDEMIVQIRKDEQEIRQLFGI